MKSARREFGPSPKTSVSLVVPDPTRSPHDHDAEWQCLRAPRSGSRLSRVLFRLTKARPARTGLPGSSSSAFGVTEIRRGHHHPRDGRQSRRTGSRFRRRASGRCAITSESLRHQDVLRASSSRQIAEHHREVATLGQATARGRQAWSELGTRRSCRSPLKEASRAALGAKHFEPGASLVAASKGHPPRAPTLSRTDYAELGALRNIRARSWGTPFRTL